MRVGVGEVGCVKNRCFVAFKCGKQRGQAREWGITSGPWIPLTWNEVRACVRLLLCERHALKDGGDQDTLGVIHAQEQPCQTLCYCVTVHLPASTQGLGYSLLAQNQSSILGRGKCLWCPLSLNLWSIHPVMNDEVVKGGKAGVHLSVCLQAVMSFSVDLLRAYTAGAKLVTSFCLSHTLCTVDKTNQHAQTNYGSRMYFYQSWGLWQNMATLKENFMVWIPSTENCWLLDVSCYVRVTQCSAVFLCATHFLLKWLKWSQSEFFKRNKQ